VSCMRETIWLSRQRGELATCSVLGGGVAAWQHALGGCKSLDEKDTPLGAGPERAD
jgi:hypothetical protein